MPSPWRGSGCLRTSPQPFEVEQQLISTWYAILVSGDIQYGVELSQSSPERRIPEIVGHASNCTRHPPHATRACVGGRPGTPEQFVNVRMLTHPQPLPGCTDVRQPTKGDVPQRVRETRHSLSETDRFGTQPHRVTVVAKQTLSVAANVGKVTLRRVPAPGT